ncbi:hypothetical protein [Xenorhabdus anantnagensis]|uniref:hypothetical protein n=1 Tax=Xenorhabdus anantnagensis TaxID=3025875 RepID=UPI00351DD71D
MPKCRKSFFRINAFKKHHRFNPGKTFNLRKQFLGQCSSADPVVVSQNLAKSEGNVLCKNKFS